MPAPVSLVPPRPGDGSGICEYPETECERDARRQREAREDHWRKEAQKRSPEHYKERVAWAAERWWQRRKEDGGSE